MDKSKYGKYIQTETEPDRPDLADIRHRILYLDNNVLPGAFYLSCCWYLKASDKALGEGPHVHDFDEVITFIGSNPKDPHDLGGEIELWLGDEKHMLTKSCLIFIPKGLSHCPFFIRRAERPIFHFSTGPSKAYVKGKAKVYPHGNEEERK